LRKIKKPQPTTTVVNGPEKFNQIFFYREEDTIVAMGKENFKFLKLPHKS
jgi:hypothetical protein